MKAAASGYFGKALEELTLAENAILAAIPQSPTKFDLMRNAEEVCLDRSPPDPESDEECKKVQLEVPATSEIVQRRNYVLDLMKTRSPLSGDRHTTATSTTPPSSSRSSSSRRSPRPGGRRTSCGRSARRSTTIVCPDTPTDCEEVDTGGYRVTTTLDWKMQKIAEKWVFVAARAPQSKNPRAILRSHEDPERAIGAGSSTCAVATSTTPPAPSWTTGPARSSPTSAARATPAKGTKKFQPQFDVLSDGWRQPGSSIKPIDYAIGIDDETITASTMFMDVVTDFGRGFTPTQADKLERGPVRVRSALQFSLNIPAIKAHDHAGPRAHVRAQPRTSASCSRRRPSRSCRWASARSRRTRSTCCPPTATIANGGVRMPRQLITKVVDENGRQVWPLD